eukprot:5479100-Pyramimonas_sp.AAC.1
MVGVPNWPEVAMRNLPLALSIELPWTTILVRCVPKWPEVAMRNLPSAPSVELPMRPPSP